MKRTLSCLVLIASLTSVTRADAQTFSHFESGTNAVDSITGLSRIQVYLGADSGRVLSAEGTAIMLASLQASSVSDNPDQFGPPSNQYTIEVTLTDDASAQNATLTFTGEFGGYLSGGFVSQANITNAYHEPLSQTVTLGAYTYTVALGYFLSPGPPGSGQNGSLSAHVTATAIGPTPIQKVIKSASILGGCAVPTADDIAALDIEKEGDSSGRIDLLDVVAWARKASGLDP